jgi:hypothetical protein
MPEPVTFPEANAVFTSKTEGVSDLPCFVNEEMTVACWKLTDEERKLVAETGFVWLGQMNYGKPLQPQAVWFKNPFVPWEVVGEVTQ